MDEKQIKRRMRRDIGSYGWGLLIYYGLMNLCVLAAILLEMAISTLLDTGSYDPMGNGWGYLVACVIAVAAIRLWKGKDFFAGMWKNENHMTPAAFCGLVCLFVSGQLLFQICASVQEMVLNWFGLSILEAMELATGSSDTLSMFLYTVLAAPVVEEIIFRGLVLRGLERYGRGFAILISAMLFGLFHGNIVQSPYAFAVGLILGYTALEYNILWAMVLHMVNNLVLADALPRVTQGLGEIGSAMVSQGGILLCSAGALIFLVLKRWEIRAYLERNKPDWAPWWAFATAPGILAMVVVMELNAFSMLFA